jgi:hypothetical protein
MNKKQLTSSVFLLLLLLPIAGLAQTVPAGTEIVVSLQEMISSNYSGAGQRYRATVDDPIVVGDRVVIPRGAPASVQIVQQAGGKEISLKLYDITVNGKRYDVASDYATVKSSGKTGKTVRRGVGLGALGAGIGAIAGGGRGAAIGAAAGGGLGVTSGLLSKSKIELPRESRLGFVLRGALPLN